MNKKTLILGASGYLGQEILNYIGKEKCTGTTFRKGIKGLIKIDLTRKGELERILEITDPEIIINCLNLGGFLDKDSEQTRKVNYGVNKKLSEVFNKKIVYFSTDSVFDGKKGDYTEEDRPNPINNYGKTKYMGENILLERNNKSLILRLGVLYKNVNGGYMKFVYDNLKEGNKIESWIDIISCPTHIDDVCHYLKKLLDNDSTGIFHLTGSEKISRYDFAKIIALNLGLKSELIHKREYTGEIKRPKDTSMISIKLKEKLRGVEI